MVTGWETSGYKPPQQREGRELRGNVVQKKNKYKKQTKKTTQKPLASRAPPAAMATGAGITMETKNEKKKSLWLDFGHLEWVCCAI